MSPTRLEAIIFDLDGTLVDSGTDIAAAANHALAMLGRPPLPEEAILGYVGDGVPTLLGRCLGGEDRLVPEGMRHFRAWYTDHALDHTSLYPGIGELLAALEHLPLAVVSNKQEEFCRRILEALGVARHFRRIVGGDTYSERKPSPLPFLEVLAEMGVTPSRALVVGDGVQDLVAARAAGIRTCAVHWGYGDPDRLAAETPDQSAATVAELDVLLRSLLGP